MVGRDNIADAGFRRLFGYRLIGEDTYPNLTAAADMPYDSAAGSGCRAHFEVSRDEAGKLTAKRRVTTAGTTLHTLTRGERTAR